MAKRFRELSKLSFITPFLIILTVIIHPSMCHHLLPAKPPSSQGFIHSSQCLVRAFHDWIKCIPISGLRCTAHSYTLKKKNRSERGLICYLSGIWKLEIRLTWPHLKILHGRRKFTQKYIVLFNVEARWGTWIFHLLFICLSLPPLSSLSWYQSTTIIEVGDI